MLSCLASEIFSIIAASPVKPPIVQGKQGIMYSENLDLMSLDVYLHEVGAIIKSGKAVYENLSIDMYYQGKAINRKYRLLRISYTIFIIGLIISVVSFLIVFFAS